MIQPCIWEAEAGGPQVQGHPQILSKFDQVELYGAKSQERKSRQGILDFEWELFSPMLDDQTMFE